MLFGKLDTSVPIPDWENKTSQLKAGGRGKKDTRLSSDVYLSYSEAPG